MRNKNVEIDDLCISNLKVLRELDGHKICIKQYSETICEDLPLFRYVRLSHLIDSISNGRMFIPSIKQFSDLIEKNGCKKHNVFSAFQYCPSYHDNFLYKKRDKEMDNLLCMCAKCWTLDKRSDGTTGESMLMWRTYSNNEIVCRIETTLHELVNSFVKLSSSIIIADVNYGRQDNLNVFEQLLFNKAIYYDQEQEVRMLYLVNNSNGIYIDTDILSMIKQITISPFIPQHTASFIISQLRKICKDNPKIEMQASHINEYEGDLPRYVNDNKVWR